MLKSLTLKGDVRMFTQPTFAAFEHKLIRNL